MSDNETLHTGYFNSPIGIIKIVVTNLNVKEISFVETGLIMKENHHPLIENCITQLSKYFEGELSSFNLPILNPTSEFQEKVMAEVQKVPFGSVASYLQIAKRIGDPSSVRAVGGVNAKNKILIVIPCHRIVGNNGELTGYAGGVWRKQWLLKHESKQAGVGQISLFS